jgi:CheY-like chemotaxis protein
MHTIVPKWRQFSDSKPKRILVVDDDAVLREIAKPILSGLGYEVLLMADGLHEDRFFAKLKVDAAIVDFGLPHISGLEIIQKIRASENGRKIPIFVISGSADAHEVRACYEDGNVSLVLSKPVDWSLLIGELKAAIGA